MNEPEFVRLAPDGVSWYSTSNPDGFLDRDDWETCFDPLRMGPFDTEDEARAAIDEFLEANGIDMGGMMLCARHAEEVLEADKEHYPGNELAKRRFQSSAKIFAQTCATGNPPAEIVALTAGSLFMHLCAAYPTAGTEVFRRIGNLLRQDWGIPIMELGEKPNYEQ